MTTIPGRFAVIRPCLIVFVACLLGGCSTLGYYYQSATGQLELLCKARDIEDVIRDDKVAPVVRDRLQQVTAIRAFASRTLHLPDNHSYTRYADLERDYVVWNVFAAPPLSTQPHEWCFPIVGCVVYRGYFDQESARRYADSLTAQGLETYVAGVPAYSTLGWFDDPVLNTVIGYPEAELAGLIFHELAHQVAYVPNDSVFNESFATAVEDEGVKRWLANQGRPADIRAYRLRRQRDAKVVETILAHRRRLDQVYRSDGDRQWKLARKSEIIASLKSRYTRMISDWDGYRGYSGWFRQDLNNAHFAVIAAYHDKVPAFQALLAREGGDLSSFYDAVIALSRLAPAEREARLAALQEGATDVSQ